MARMKQLVPRLDLYTGSESGSDEGQFLGCWELELLQGEATDRHEHREGEEMCYVLHGQGAIEIGEQRGPIKKGDVVHVPPATSHLIANPSSKRLRCLLVESSVVPDPEDEPLERRTVGDIDTVMGQMPRDVDEASAIQAIVKLFDIGGAISDQIETAFGLDNQEGVEALTRIEKKIMRAVVEITRRYSLPRRGLPGI